MDKSFESQLGRSEELLRDLEAEVENSLSQRVVSSRLENISHELLLKLGRILDQLMVKCFKNCYFPLLSVDQSEKKLKSVYFPVCENEQKLRSRLKDVGMADLEQKDNNFFRLLQSSQPYSADENWWITHLKRYANATHIEIIPQVLSEEHETILGSAVRVGRGARVSMNNCYVGGVLVNSTDINTEPLGNFDPRLNVQRLVWTSVVFKDTGLDVLKLCRDSKEGVTKLCEAVSG